MVLSCLLICSFCFVKRGGRMKKARSVVCVQPHLKLQVMMTMMIPQYIKKLSHQYQLSTSSLKSYHLILGKDRILSQVHDVKTFSLKI